MSNAVEVTILVANHPNPLADFPAHSQIECCGGFPLPCPAAAGQTKMLHGKGLEIAKKVKLLATELLKFTEFYVP